MWLLLMKHIELGSDWNEKNRMWRCWQRDDDVAAITLIIKIS